MRVLYYLPHLGTIGADRWIYEGWKFAFTDLGHEFRELTAHDDWEAAVREMRPDLMFLANLADLPRRWQALRRARERETIVFLIVHWPMHPRDVEVIRTQNIADIYFGEREPESMTEFEAATGRCYHVIPNAANRRWHVPAQAVARYAYDIAYLGAYLPKKRKKFDEVLRPAARKYHCGIFGPYWTATDNVLRGLQQVTRRLRLPGVAERINRLRIAIPPDEENQLYSSAKICVNFHEREKDDSQPHYIVNQRTFKIPACGGFQICDFVPAVRKYFDEDEVVMAQESDDWFDKIEYYLAHDGERAEIQQRGTARALRDHTYHNRVAYVLELCQRVLDDLGQYRTGLQ